MTETLTNRYWASTYFKILIFLVAFLGLVGGGLMYLGAKSRLSSALIKDKTCAAPCWGGITLGQTNPDEAYTTLEKLVWVNADTLEIDQSGEQVDKIVWKFKRPAGDTMGFIYFEDELAIAQTFLTSGSLDLGQGIDLLGQPEQIGSQVDGDRLEIILLYPSKGFLVNLSPEIPPAGREQAVELSAKTPVTQVSYFEPARLEMLFAPEYLLNGLPWLRLSDFRPWTGYGKITPEL